MVKKKNQVLKINFHGHELLTVNVNGEGYTALKPICDGIGIDWSTQVRKLTKNKRYGHMTIPYQTPSGVQDMVCIPIKKINGWLFSINPEKVKPECKPLVEMYQEECFDVLYNYWHNGGVINPRATEDQLKYFISTITEQAGHIKYLSMELDKAAKVIDIMKPTSPYGEISKATGLPKEDFIHSYFKSNSRSQNSAEKAIKLLLPLFEAIVNYDEQEA